jgi:DNA-binding MarR family transcriptional regulator
MTARSDGSRGIGFLLADVSRLLRRDFDRRVRSLGMTQAQWRAIAHIARDEGINQTTLADRLEVTPITIARLIDRLESTGWVTRCADAGDRRASLLYLTPKTKPLLERLQVHADEAREAMLRGLSRNDRRALVEALERMKRNLAATTSEQDTAGRGTKTDGHTRTRAI